MKVLSDLDVSGKKVFLRGDLDVSLVGNEMDTSTRLMNLRPTVDFLLKNGAQMIILAGHMGRPKGADPKLSTKELIPRLRPVLKKEIVFNGDLNISESQSGAIHLLENLRFWPGEVENDAGFAKQLAGLADVYVNDAFGNCHRAHASMVALPALLPHAAGVHLAEEVEVFTKLLTSSERPLIAIVGGAKIETKIPVIENLSKFADFVLIGGMLPIEIEAEGSNILSEVEGSKILSEVEGSKFRENVIVGKLDESKKDISDATITEFSERVSMAKTIVWNGPLGMFEQGFEKGSLAVAQAVVNSGAYSVVGGGETTQFLAGANLLAKCSFVSSGGGAMLEFLAGKELPGLVALN